MRTQSNICQCWQSLYVILKPALAWSTGDTNTAMHTWISNALLALLLIIASYGKKLLLKHTHTLAAILAHLLARQSGLTTTCLAWTSTRNQFHHWLQWCHTKTHLQTTHTHTHTAIYSALSVAFHHSLYESEYQAFDINWIMSMWMSRDNWRVNEI